MSEPDLLVDTSVALAVVLADHEAHDRTIEALRGQVLGLAGHAWFETYSVLTRLPPPARRRPAEVEEIIDHDFPASRFVAAEDAATLTALLAPMGIIGGAVYDALVAYAAVTHDRPLASRDRRAAGVYRALGATVDLLA